MARSKVFKSKTKPVSEELPSDDEIDAFNKQKDFVSLDAAKESDSDDVPDEGLYDLSDDVDGSSDDEYDSDDSDAEGGTLGRLKRTEKAMRNKLSVQQGEEGDEDDDEMDASAKDKQWGKSKRGYYGADTEDYELTDDDEALKDEEEEAQRLQREAAEQLQPEDFEQEQEEDANSSSDEETDTMGAKARQADAVASGGVGGPAVATVERLERDAGGLTDEQRMAAVMADAPELAALLSELQSSLAEVRSHVGPVLNEVRGGKLATAEGVSYLEAKHLLLLHYCINIVFYLLLKAEGRPVRDHPVIARLLELRAYLEKIRPIDKKLQYQMEKLLMVAQLQVSGKGDERAADSTAALADPLRFGPKPDQLIPKLLPQDSEAAEGGVYRPPRLNPVSMDDNPDKDYGKKERRRQQHAARKAGRSEFVQALASELEGAPEELRASNVVAGNETLEALRHRQKLEARAAEEEDLMVRVPLSKEQRKKLKADRRGNLSGAAMMNDFADDVADLVGMEDGGVDERFLGHQASQRFGADLLNLQRGKVRSGDDDLSGKLPLSQRRAKLDGSKSRQAARSNAFGSEDDEGDHQPRKRDREPVEDDFYREAKALAEGKKTSKKSKYTAPDTLPPRPDPTVEGARAITNDIEKNRGLTPHRSKATKNPRKHNRNKFEKAKMRRKGQVQEVKSGAAGGYGGEKTGIKSGVTRGVRF